LEVNHSSRVATVIDPPPADSQGGGPEGHRFTSTTATTGLVVHLLERNRSASAGVLQPGQRFDQRRNFFRVRDVQCVVEISAARPMLLRLASQRTRTKRIPSGSAGRDAHSRRPFESRAMRAHWWRAAAPRRARLVRSEHPCGSGSGRRFGSDWMRGQPFDQQVRYCGGLLIEHPV